jgi:hypothetical protein
MLPALWSDLRKERSAIYQHAPDVRAIPSNLPMTNLFGAVPFGLVYASNPKYLTGFDHGLSANVGLKFNLFPSLK